MTNSLLCSVFFFVFFYPFHESKKCILFLKIQIQEITDLWFEKYNKTQLNTKLEKNGSTDFKGCWPFGLGGCLALHISILITY